MTKRKNINFNYKNEEYEIKSNQFFDIGEQIEEFIEFSDIANGTYKVAKVCRAFDVILRSQGVKEELQDIKESFFNEKDCNKEMILAISNILIPIITPPENVSKHAKKKTPKKRVKKA